MADNFIRINIAFILPAGVAESVAKLSRKISEKEDVHFVIDNKNFFPHITIYSPDYPKQDSDKVFDIIEELSKNLSSIKFKTKKILANQGFLGIEFDYSKEMKYIHESIVRALNPLRGGHILKKYIDAYDMNFSEDKKINIQKYGYPNSMNFYHPHMTITRLKNEKDAEKIISKMQWPVEEFVVDKIGAYKMGENGTCVELIKEFNLGKIL